MSTKHQSKHIKSYFNKIEENNKNKKNASEQIRNLRQKIDILENNIKKFDLNIKIQNEKIDSIHGKTKLVSNQNIVNFHNDFFYIEYSLDKSFILKSNFFKSKVLEYVKQYKNEYSVQKQLYPKNFYMTQNIFAYWSKCENKGYKYSSRYRRNKESNDNDNDNDLILPNCDIFAPDTHNDLYCLTFTVLIVENNKLYRKLAYLEIECLRFPRYVEIIYADKNEIIVKIETSMRESSYDIISDLYKLKKSVIRDGKEYYYKTEELELKPTSINLVQLFYNMNFKVNNKVDINFDYQMCHHPSLCFIAIANAHDIKIYSFLHKGLSNIISILPDDIINRINSFITGINTVMKLLKTISLIPENDNRYRYYSEIPEFRMFMDDNKFYFISDKLSYEIDLFKLYLQ